MRIIEKTILYELTPEEREDATLENEMINEARLGWDATNIPRKNNMIFDANYNRYYAKVTYVRTPPIPPKITGLPSSLNDL